MASTGSRRDRDAAVHRVLVLIHRYSVDFTVAAATALALPAPTNADIQLLLATIRAPGTSSSDLAATTGVPRNDTSRSLNRLESHGLVTRTRDSQDRRVVHTTATPRGHQAKTAFDRILADYFRDSAPTVKEVLHLLDHTPPATTPPPMTALQAVEALTVAGRHAHAGMVRAGRTYGVESPRDRFAIALLSEYSHLRPSQLADSLAISRAAATALTIRLGDLDLIHRDPGADAHDRRAVAVTLTPRGHTAIRRIVRALDKDIDAVAVALARTLGPFKEHPPAR